MGAAKVPSPLGDRRGAVATVDEMVLLGARPCQSIVIANPVIDSHYSDELSSSHRPDRRRHGS